MSKSNNWETGLMQLVFNNTNFALIGDATGLRGSETPGSFYLSLHTADPGEEGNQTTNETSYGGYVRVAVARSAGGFTVSGNSVSPTVDIDFAECSSGTPTITHVGIGTSSSGNGVLLYKGALNTPISVVTGTVPRIKTGSTLTED